MPNKGLSWTEARAILRDAARAAAPELEGFAAPRTAAPPLWSRRALLGLGAVAFVGLGAGLDGPTAAASGGAFAVGRLHACTHARPSRPRSQ